MIFDFTKRLAEQRAAKAARYSWHKWFAWFPVQIDTGVWAWMEPVYRRFVGNTYGMNRWQYDRLPVDAGKYYRNSK